MSILKRFNSFYEEDDIAGKTTSFHVRLSTGNGDRLVSLRTYVFDTRLNHVRKHSHIL